MVLAESLSRQALSNELHCALESRYIRYVVVNQQLSLQIDNRPATFSPFEGVWPKPRSALNAFGSDR